MWIYSERDAIYTGKVRERREEAKSEIEALDVIGATDVIVGSRHFGFTEFLPDQTAKEKDQSSIRTSGIIINERSKTGGVAKMGVYIEHYWAFHVSYVADESGSMVVQ